MGKSLRAIFLADESDRPCACQENVNRLLANTYSYFCSLGCVMKRY